MLKQLLLLLLAATALAVPAQALGDDQPAPPQAPARTQPSRDAGQGLPSGPLARLRRIHRRLHVLVQRCRKAHGAEREQCLRKLLSTLDQVKSKLDDVESSIKAKCAAPDAPKACARAEKLIRRLESLKAQIDKLEAKIKEHLSSDSGPPSASASSDSDSTSDVDSVASLDAALAAVEQQP